MDLEAEIRAGAVRALRKAADKYAVMARDGMSIVENYPGVLIRSGEAAVALRQAVTLTALADELEAEGSAP